MDPEDRAGEDRAQASWLRYTHLGLQYCITLLLFLAAGRWLDGRLGTEPWLMVVAACLGFGAATYLLVRQTQRIRS